MTLWSDYNQTGQASPPLSNSAPRLASGWNDNVKSVHNAMHLNITWLLEESYAFDAPFDVNVHFRVANESDFEAWRVCFDEQNCQENAAPINELFYTWNTYGVADGNHKITLQYRRTSDNYDWNNADKYEAYFYLSENRQTYAPCNSNANGAILVSGSDCIIVTTSIADLDPVEWADRSDLSITAQGYDVLAYVSSDFQGWPIFIHDGESISVGNNVSGIELRQPLPDSYLPTEPIGVDDYTVVYLPMNEESGTQVYSSVGSLVGNLSGSASLVEGRFGNAVNFTRPPEGNGINFGAQDFGSTMTVEMFVKQDNVDGDQRIAAQLGGGQNTGPSKWILGLNNGRFKVSLCWVQGCHEAFGLEDVQTDRWYYLMFTYDGGTTGQFYIDTVLQATINMDGTVPSGATTFEIGKGEDIAGCNCTVDDVRISNIVRDHFDPSEPTPTPEPSPTPAPVIMDLDVVVSDPSTSDSRSITHNYASAGTYTVSFSVHGPDELPHILSQEITVSNYECDGAVTLPGIILFDYVTCASANESDRLQLTDLGLYDLGNFSFDNKATSIHFPQDGSLSAMLYEGVEGTGQSVCRNVDMWNMQEDLWPDQSAMDNTVSSIEVFDTIGCTPHPVMDMSYSLLDPHGQIQLDVNWSGAADGSWQIINWGDGSDYGVQGASGTASPTHWYPGSGTYTITFQVTNAGPDWGVYTITDEVTVNLWECGNAVAQSGVTFYNFSTCAYRDTSDYEEFTSDGTYNLTGLDNQTTSLHVPSGKSVSLFEGADQTGDSMCVSGDMWAMDTDTWPLGGTVNDSVSSLQIFSNTTCTP